MCTCPVGGGPPAAWQGPQFRTNNNPKPDPKTNPIPVLRGGRFRLIVDD